MPEPTYKIAQRLLASRAAVGVKQYGDDLTANSPGCMLVHALEEAADQVNYLLAEIQRRRESLILLIEVAKYLKAEGQYGYGDTITTVIDILGGESALAQYDEILGGGTVAQNATVDARDEAKANHKAHATQVGAVEWVCRCECGWIERYETTGEGAGALCEWHMAKAAGGAR